MQNNTELNIACLKSIAARSPRDKWQIWLTSEGVAVLERNKVEHYHCPTWKLIWSNFN